MRRRREAVQWLAFAPLASLFASHQGEEAYALVAGTVFREPGFALPGARVTLEPLLQKGSESRKTKKLEAVTSPRGEFSFRVPAGEASYRLTAEAKGFETESKEVTVHADERVDVFFQLRAAKP